MEKRVYVLDGSQFSSLNEFAATFSSVVLENWQWNGNLDAFNDILRGGFGTPEDGFVLQWENSALSRERLNEPVPHQGKPMTVFEVLIEIIRDHGAGGTQEKDAVELKLL